MTAILEVLFINESTANFLTYLFIFLVSALGYIHLKHRQTKLFKLGNKIPGPPSLPFFGNALLAIRVKTKDVVRLALMYRNKYGQVIRGWLGHRLFIFLTNPEDVEIILSSHEHIEKSSEYEFFEPWLHNGLLIINGEKWRSNRKMLAPTFHMNILKSFMPRFNENAKYLVKQLRSELGKSFDVHDNISGTSVDILLETVMGINRKTKSRDGYDYAMAVMKLCDIIHQRHFKLWLRLNWTFKFSSLFKKQIELLNKLQGFTKKVIKTKKETYLSNKAKGIIPATIEELTKSSVNKPQENAASLSDNIYKHFQDDIDINDDNDVGEKRRLAFLDLLLESSQNGLNNLTDQDIKDQVNTIMFAGHDTVAAGASFFLTLMGGHQNIQDKVYEELFEIFGDSDRPATFADTVQMKQLERAILETLRLFPPVPVIGRLIKEDVTIKTNNYVIPAGATVILAPYMLHRDPRYYKNPNKFDPDNFLPENVQRRHYYSFVPFSAGPRSCIGRKYGMLKLKVLLSTILRNYKIVSEIPKETDLKADIILKISNGFKINIKPRKDC